jgi:WD40 repeat protein
MGSYGTSVSFSSDGQYLASADLDDSISLWPLGNPKPEDPSQTALVIDNAHSDGVYDVSFSPQGSLFASAGGDQIVKIWDSSNLRAAPKLFKGHQDSVNRVQFSPDGKQLISVGKDNKAILWDIETGKQLARLEAHAAPIWGVAFSPQGEAIATASADDTVNLWSNDGKLLKTLRGHTNIVMDVQFSNHDASLLFSASDDKTIKVWREGQLVTTLMGHSEGINALSLKDSTLISGGADGKVILWNTDLLSLENMLREGCIWAEAYFQTQTTKVNPCKNLKF